MDHCRNIVARAVALTFEPGAPCSKLFAASSASEKLSLMKFSFFSVTGFPPGLHSGKSVGGSGRTGRWGCGAHMKMGNRMLQSGCGASMNSPVGSNSLIGSPSTYAYLFQLAGSEGVPEPDPDLYGSGVLNLP